MWATCMRSHGDPNQPDPTIDAHGGINIFIPGSAAASLSNAVHNGTAPCNGYLATASADLRAGATDLTPPDQDALLRYSQCMRANGVPNYPDPGAGSEMNFNGTDPNSPFFLRANDKCGKQIDAPSWWISGARPPGTSRWRVARCVGTRSAPRPAPTAHGEARRHRPPVADVHTRPNTVLAVIARRWLRVLTPRSRAVGRSRRRPSHRQQTGSLLDI